VHRYHAPVHRTPRSPARAVLAGIGVLVVAVLLAGAGCAAEPTGAPDPTTPAVGSEATAPPRTEPRGTSTTEAPSGSTVPDRPVDPIVWEPCGARRECATYPVPVHHDDPDGATIDLAVIRRPATGTDRIGSLFLNPGGPGGSGVDYVTATPLDPTLNQYFDIVSWDPRGVGASEPIDCDTGATAMQRTDWDPDDAAEQAALDDAAEAIAQDCADEYGERLRQVATDDTVRDLDLLRQAVGDEQLTYLGFSYGTAIGLRYADLFPDRVRAIVLDGVVDPTQDLEELLTDQATTFESTLDGVFAKCAATPTCPVQDPAATYDRVHAAVESTPLAVAGSDPVGPTALAYAALSSAYDEGGGEVFLEALAAADAGNGAGLRRLADQYWSSTSYTEYAAVVCTDNPHPEGADEYQAMAERMAAAAPRVGAAVANEMLPCAFWDAPVTGRPGPVAAPGAPPILVVGNTGDSATPFAAAEKVADDLESGVLLTYRGAGHTSFGSDTCVKDVVRFYLVDLVVPDAGTECPEP